MKIYKEKNICENKINVPFHMHLITDGRKFLGDQNMKIVLKQKKEDKVHLVKHC